MSVSLTKVTTINLTFTEEVAVYLDGGWSLTTELKGCRVLARTADRITVQYGVNRLVVPLSDLATTGLSFDEFMAGMGWSSWPGWGGA